MSVNLHEKGQCVHLTISPSGGSRIVPQTEQNGQDIAIVIRKWWRPHRQIDGWLQTPGEGYKAILIVTLKRVKMP